MLENDPDCVQKILNIINRTTCEFKDIPAIDTMVSKRYDQQLEDVQTWLSITEWSQEQLSENEVNRVQQKLLQLELIDETVAVKDLLI